MREMQWTIIHHIKRKEKPEEKKASAEAYKEKSISNRQSFIVYVILILMFAVITSWCGFTIYQQGRNDAAKEIVLDTVNMDDRTYVVLKKYNDSWILKECKFVDNGIRINKDAYFIADISGKKILRYSVKENQSLEEWMLGDIEFNMVKAKENTSEVSALSYSEGRAHK